MAGRKQPRTRGRGLREEPAAFAAKSNVREIAASEAKTHFAELLNAVERGETIAITRHGRRIARLLPDEEGRREQVRKAIAKIEKLAKERREKFGPVSVEEILSSIHEGHKY